MPIVIPDETYFVFSFFSFVTILFLKIGKTSNTKAIVAILIVFILLYFDDKYIDVLKIIF